MLLFVRVHSLREDHTPLLMSGSTQGAHTISLTGSLALRGWQSIKTGSL